MRESEGWEEPVRSWVEEGGTTGGEGVGQGGRYKTTTSMRELVKMAHGDPIRAFQTQSVMKKKKITKISMAHVQNVPNLGQVTDIRSREPGLESVYKPFPSEYRSIWCE